VIERVNESRPTREARAARGLTLFDVWKGDEGDTFAEGWRNKLIWGDNRLVMGSLRENLAGMIDLVYIDPPFGTGVDFSVRTPVGEDADLVTKDQSIIEEKAYRDTWGRGIDSYLQMMSERLQLIRELLKPDGTLYLHTDWGLGHYLKIIADEIFGKARLRNEIIWYYANKLGTGGNTFDKQHDVLYVYTKGETWRHNPILRDVRNQKMQPVTKKIEGKRVWLRDDEGKRVYQLGSAETKIGDVWEIPIINPVSNERLGYATQKPEALIERIIRASTDEGQIVADFFVGSGTTAAVAERLNRRWIACDLGRYAVHLTRKRLLDLKDCRPFEILNLGKYERRYWQVATFGEDLDADGVISIYEYVAFILKLYGATPTTGLDHLHGKLGTAFVHVGAVDAPVTIGEVASCVEECVALKAGDLHVLGWEWEMGMNDLVSEEAKRRGVKAVLRQIPREVMEEQAAAKGDVQFFELAYLDAHIEHAEMEREYVVELQNFVIPNPELISNDVRGKITKWSDYVDYWAVDWDFRDDAFMQGWVTYRTRKNRKLELMSAPHTYEEPGEYSVMVKVIDVFGNDTSSIIRVTVD
jgi:adenine-specific DNA-methyltransferase